ncbi:hypothetical protein [Thermoactinospora rubra]|uniref:hypothetical protein n=1 Tax=Thermoactinospora rubra TaxID=1088767 RepID=UPI000A10F129|nr:hypothetical protein [Thermoactinospora rubra]
MAVNALLLRATLAHIEAHPETWNQKVYRCKSGMCFAGWAAELAGGRWITQDPTAPFSLYLAADRDDDPDYVREFPLVGRVIDVDDRARQVLGLDDDQADELFSADNGIDDIRRIVGELINTVHHVTIRLVPDDQRGVDEVVDGRAPLEILERHPDRAPVIHGTELGIPREQLRDRARATADRLGVPYIDPIDLAALALLPVEVTV